MNGRRTVIIFGITLSTFQPSSHAQAANLIDLIPSLYGGDGITLAPPSGDFPSHEAHFTTDASLATTELINLLNSEIAGEIRPISVTPSSGGVTFKFDPEQGTYTKTTESLGPIVAERPQTLGKGKYSLGLAFTFFQYDKFEGQSLNNLNSTLTHSDVGNPGIGDPSFEFDTINVNFDIDLEYKILLFGGTYGLTDNLDVGIVVPVVNADMDVKANATVVHSPQSTFSADIHQFDPNGEQPFDSKSGSATGIGDVFLGAKYYWLDKDWLDMSGALSVKLETGDEKDFLGTGSTTIRPFLIASGKIADWVIPHLNLGYEFDLDDSDKNVVTYAAGMEIGNDTLVGVVDLLGRHEPNGDDIGKDIVDVALGGKWSPYRNIILTANFIVPVNKDEGLRSDLVSTVAFEYRN